MSSIFKKERFLKIIPFVLAGAVSAIASSIFWDPDDNGPLIATLPGWSFAVMMLIGIFWRHRNFHKVYIVSSFAWLLASGACFWSAVLLVMESDLDLGMVTPGLAGGGTTALMLGMFSVLFGLLSVRSIVWLSLLAGVVSGVSFFGGPIALFFAYHLIVGLGFGWAMGNINEGRQMIKSWPRTLGGLVVALGSVWVMFFPANMY